MILGCYNDELWDSILFSLEYIEGDLENIGWTLAFFPHQRKIK